MRQPSVATAQAVFFANFWNKINKILKIFDKLDHHKAKGSSANSKGSDQWFLKKSISFILSYIFRVLPILFQKLAKKHSLSCGNTTCASGVWCTSFLGISSSFHIILFYILTEQIVNNFPSPQISYCYDFGQPVKLSTVNDHKQVCKKPSRLWWLK